MRQPDDADIPDESHDYLRAEPSSEREELSRLMRNMDGLEEIDRACQVLCTQLRFSHYHLSLSVPVSIEQPVVVALNRFPEAWQRHYRHAGYHLEDPILERSSRSTIPFFWDDINLQSRGRKVFFSDAQRFGVGFGLTFPFAGPLNTTGFLSFSRSDGLTLSPDNRRQWVAPAMWFTVQLLEAARTLALRSCGASTSGAGLLTRRERECLALSAEGHTTSQIAMMLTIAPRTVAFHIDRSVAKLRVHSRRAALRRALLLGEIDLQHVTQSRNTAMQGTGA